MSEKHHSISAWWFKQLIKNPMGGKRRVVAGRTLTGADKKKLRDKHPGIYEDMREGLDMDFVCYDDIRKAIDRYEDRK